MSKPSSTPGLWARLLRRLVHRGRSPGRAAGLGRALSSDAAARTDIPAELYAQRERLYACALQLLDDPHAARQVVAEALQQTAMALAQGGASPKSVAVDSGSDASLSGLLDRSVIRLALLRLRVTPAAVQASDGLEGTADEPSDGRTVRSEPFEGAASLPSDGVGQLERIGDALNGLPAEIRAVIALVVMQGRSIAATAELLGIGEDACSFFLGHGRKLLRRALQRDLVAAEDVLGAGAILLQPRDLNDLHGSKKATARA